LSSRPDRTGAAVRAGWRRAAVLLAVALVAAGCGGSTSTLSAPSITVVTGLWPLAQAAAAIGQGNVVVDDVVPAGVDPTTYSLGASARARVHSARLALEIGGGFEPSFEAAAPAARTVRLLPSAGASPYVWLNPFAMERTDRTIAAALERANPAAAATYRTGLDNVEAELGALDDDYQSTLSSCPDEKLVTFSDAFVGLHPRYPVTDDVVGSADLTPDPSAATVDREVAAIKATGSDEIYNETWIPESDILAATTRTKVKVGSLNTLEGPPTAKPWPYQAGREYVTLMENNLSSLSSALHCPNAADN
jgi:ABC-type Zn uptake system ZnuABC Zn-binding protein ZnuA